VSGRTHLRPIQPWTGLDLTAESPPNHRQNTAKTVDKLCTSTLSGDPVTLLAGGAFGYNGRPNKAVAIPFCWKARHLFDVPFF
jgi:hypothetical protein